MQTPDNSKLNGCSYQVSVHPQRRNVTTSLVGIEKKKVTYAKISPTMNPRDIAGELRRRRVSHYLYKLYILGTTDCTRLYQSSVLSQRMSGNAYCCWKHLIFHFFNGKGGVICVLNTLETSLYNGHSTHNSVKQCTEAHWSMKQDNPRTFQSVHWCSLTNNAICFQHLRAQAKYFECYM